MKGLCCLITVLFSFRVLGQTYTGKVFDAETGESLPGANVFLVNDWRIGTVTNGDGEFLLEVPASSKSDSAIISFIGFREKVLPVSGLNGTHMLAHISSQLEQVVVQSAPLIAEEFKYEKVKRLDIYLNPASKADPLLAVATMPSATNTDESANISLRGSRSIETGVYMNNVPIYDAVRFAQINGIGTFSIFNTAMIKDLTLFPGNPPLEYGNVTSGLIGLSTTDTPVKGNQTAISLGLANIGVQRTQKLSDRSSLILFSNFQPSAGLKWVNQESLESIKEFQSADLGIFFLTQPNEHFNLRYFNYSLLESYTFDFRSPSFSGNFEQGRKRNFSVLNLGYQRAASIVEMNAGFSVSHFNYQYSKSAISVNKEDVFLGINISREFRLFKVKAGFSSDNRNESGRGTFPDHYYALREEHPFSQVSFAEKIRTNELFAYAKFPYQDRLTLGLGARKNLFDERHDYLSYQVNLFYEPARHWTVVGGVGRYHKQALVENVGDESLLRSQQASVDLKYLKNGWKSYLSFFQKNNQVLGDNEQISGIEFYLKSTINSKWIGDISATLLAYDLDDNSENWEANQARYFLKGNLKYQVSPLMNVSAFFQWREGNTYYDVEGTRTHEDLDVLEPVYQENFTRLPDYFNLGLSISRVFQFDQGIAAIAYAGVNNVSNRKNIRSYTYNENYSTSKPDLFSLRTTYFGVTINF